MAIAHEAARLGIGVSKPLWDLRYALVFDSGAERLHVQCKWARRPLSTAAATERNAEQPALRHQLGEGFRVRR